MAGGLLRKGLNTMRMYVSLVKTTEWDLLQSVLLAVERNAGLLTGIHNLEDRYILSLEVKEERFEEVARVLTDVTRTHLAAKGIRFPEAILVSKTNPLTVARAGLV